MVGNMLGKHNEGNGYVGNGDGCNAHQERENGEIKK